VAGSDTSPLRLRPKTNEQSRCEGKCASLNVSDHRKYYSPVKSESISEHDWIGIVRAIGGEFNDVLRILHDVRFSTLIAAELACIKVIG
jgi:hypothetical protein